MSKIIKRSTPEKLIKKYPFLNNSQSLKDIMFNDKQYKLYCEISPIEFLRLAVPLTDSNLNSIRTSKLKLIVRKYLNDKEKWTKPIGLISDIGELDNLCINLTLDTERMKICGHEGRHRALAFIESGFEFMPVVISLMKWNTKQVYYYYDTDIMQPLKDIIFKKLENKNITSEDNRNKRVTDLFKKLGVCDNCKAKPCRINCDKLQSLNDKKEREVIK